jgi:hypothetical protein
LGEWRLRGVNGLAKKEKAKGWRFGCLESERWRVRKLLELNARNN